MEGIKMLIEVESQNGVAKCPFCSEKVNVDEKKRIKSSCDHLVASCGKLFEDEFKVYFTSTVKKRNVIRSVGKGV
jgi:transposase-like protein